MSQDPYRKSYYRAMYLAIRGQPIGPPETQVQGENARLVLETREAAIAHVFLWAMVFGFITALLVALFFMGVGAWYVFTHWL